MTETYAGKCLCGGVRYAAEGPPVIIAQCHCEECRRLSGTGHSVGAMFNADAVRITGATQEYQYTSMIGSTVTKVFCPNCGTPIYGRNSRAPGHMTLSLGTMEDAKSLAVEVVIFARDKPHWDQLAADVPSFASQPDWTPDNA